MNKLLLFALLALSILCIRVTIDDFGGVPNKDYLGAHIINQKALYAAYAAVNASSDTIK